jgi:predicted RND superfamily exporter protein
MLQSFENIFALLAEFLVRRRKQVVIAGFALGLLCLPFTVFTLRHLDANLLNQVSDRLPRFQALKEVTTDFGGDILAAVVTLSPQAASSSENVNALKNFGDLLASELALAGLSDDDQQALQRRLGDAAVQRPPQAWLRQVECRMGAQARAELRGLVQAQPHLALKLEDILELERRFEPAALKTRMREIREQLADSVSAGAEKTQLMRDPLDIKSILQRTFNATIGSQEQGLAGSDGYFLSPDGTTLLVLARPDRSSNNVAFNRVLMESCQRAENRAIAAFREKNPAAALSTSFKAAVYGAYKPGESPDPALAVGFTGLHALSVENETSLKSDILGGTVWAFLALVVIFLVAYRSLRLTLNIAVTLLLAAIVTLTIAGLTRGHVGVLGAGFTCILIGTGVDYGIMVYGTYRKLMEVEGTESRTAILQTLVRRGPGIFMACITTVIGFLGLTVVDFQAVAEFGLLTGIGLFVSSILMFVFFPLLLVRSGAAAVQREKPATPLGMKMIGRMVSVSAGRAAVLAAGAASLLVCVALLLWQPPTEPGMEKFLGVRFDPDIGNLRNRAAPASVLRDRVADKFHLGFADLRIVVEAGNEADALALSEEVQRRAEPFISSGEIKPGGSLLQFVPNLAHQDDALREWLKIDFDVKTSAFLDAAQVEFGAKSKTAFAQFVKALGEYSANAKKAHRVSIAECMSSSAGRLLARFARVDPVPEGQGQRVRLISYFYPRDLQYSETWLQSFAQEIEKPQDNQPANSKVRIAAARFVGFELKRSVIRDMEWIFAIVAVVVTVMVLYPLRSVKLSLLAMTPLLFSFLFVLGGVALAERMHWELSLNYINLMIFPILMGSAVDYGIYMVFDQYSGRFSDTAHVVEETGHSLVLCCVTTLGGYGSMIVGSNSGLTSFGWTAILGYTGALFAAVVMLPAMFGAKKTTVV